MLLQLGHGQSRQPQRRPTFRGGCAVTIPQRGFQDWLGLQSKTTSASLDSANISESACMRWAAPGRSPRKARGYQAAFSRIRIRHAKILRHTPKIPPQIPTGPTPRARQRLSSFPQGPCQFRARPAPVVRQRSHVSLCLLPPNCARRSLSSSFSNLTFVALRVWSFVFGLIFALPALIFV